MRGTFQFLGTGASAGVPLIGCKCPVCSSSSTKNKRFRPSGLLHIAGKNLLIDITPDFRSQALQFQIDSIDGLLLTHTHYDHIAGIDEVRIFNVRQKKSMPCLLSKESLEEVQKRYYYFFSKELTAKLDFTVLEQEAGQTEFLGVPIGYCSFSQGGMKVTGYRVGEFAYITDIRKYDDAIFSSLHGVKKLVISALNADPTPFHLSLKEATQFADRVGASEAWITHVSHFIEHDKANALLPPHVRIGYDGLKWEFACTN